MATGIVPQKEKPTTQILKERETALIDLKISLEEFATNVEVKFDDRWRSYSWRVQGNIDLYYWIYDHHSSRESEILTDAQVIEIAFKYLLAIQARKGQINIHSVYVQNVEEVELLPRKGLQHATVRVVKDRVDGLYRYSTNHYCGNGGGGSAPSTHSKFTQSRHEAILQGAQELIESLTASWQSKDDPATFNPFINKIKKYIENLEAEYRQPSLFG
ncbi:MAG TPA: hypothetical protein PKY82_02525 [Pyrinomonadaceae bacterium]|nr:hypothetical protein [Pyrinomonadaceae bacterium]